MRERRRSKFPRLSVVYEGFGLIFKNGAVNLAIAALIFAIIQTTAAIAQDIQMSSRCSARATRVFQPHGRILASSVVPLMNPAVGIGKWGKDGGEGYGVF